MKKTTSFLVVASLILAPVVARADDAANTATARTLGVEGVTLADAGKCKEAIEKLTRAEELRHAPTTATRLAECEIETGRLVAGTERLQRLVREPLPPGAHPAFVAAMGRAQKVLEKTLPRLATLRLSVKAPPGTKLAIAIDDESTPAAILDTARPIDPGAHKIKVSAPGTFAQEASLVVDEGGSKALTLELKPDPNYKPEAETAGRAEPSSKVPAIVAFGVGAVGLGVGIFAGAKVASTSSDLEDACGPSRTCPADRRGDVDSAKSWATVSTIGFAVAGVGVATGVVLLLTGSSTKETAKKGARPVVGLGSVGLSGNF